MRTDILKSLLLSALLCSAPGTAHAAKMFPPDNIPACAQSGGVLVWDAGQIDGSGTTNPGGVKCIGVTTSTCPPGQVMTGISGGVPVCVAQTAVTNVACGGGQVLVSISNGTQSTCANPVAGLNGSCSGNQVMVSINGGNPQCANPSGDVSIASCPAGMAMTGISNGSPICGAFAAGAASAPPAPSFPINHGVIGNTTYYFGCEAWTDGNGTAYMSDQYQGNGPADVTTNHTAYFQYACPGGAGGGVCTVDPTGLTNTCNGQFYPW